MGAPPSVEVDLVENPGPWGRLCGLWCSLPQLRLVPLRIRLQSLFKTLILIPLQKMGFTKFLVEAHCKIVNQFSKKVLVDGVVDIQMLEFTRTSIKTGPIRRVGINFNSNLTWWNVLKIVPKKFNRVTVSVPNKLVDIENAVTLRVPKKIDVMTLVFLITWHKAF